MAAARYWGRYYKLSIRLPDNGGNLVFETKEDRPSMDIKFDVTYARGQTARKGTVSILGLGFDHIHQLLALSALSQSEALAKMARLTLEVGYFSQSDKVEVLNGYIYYGTVTAPPQMWLTLNVSEYNELGGQAIKISIKDVPIKEFLLSLCKSFSEAEGVDFTYMDYTEDKIVDEGDEKVSYQSPSLSTIQDCLQAITTQLSHNVQFIMRTFSNEKDRVIEVHDKDDTKTIDDTVNVDSEHGLLSVSGISNVNSYVTTFIDARATDDLCKLKLSSELNPQANGTYVISKKQYIGHFMGPEWYIRYTCTGKWHESDKGDK